MVSVSFSSQYFATLIQRPDEEDIEDDVAEGGEQRDQCTGAPHHMSS